MPTVATGALVSPGGAQGPSGPSTIGLPIGTVMLWCAGGSPPAGWLTCDGSAVSRTLYSGLFAVIGTTFGVGDGSTTFALPDLRGRVPVGTGQGVYANATNRVLAASGGEETHQLVIAELASHFHTFGFTNTGQGTSAGGGGVAVTTATGSITTTVGGDTAHNTMQPFLVLSYIIKVSTTGGATNQAPIADTTQAGLVNRLSGFAGDYLGGDNACHSFAFIAKTAAYTLTVADSAKYVICSGGSWTLTLPAPVPGLNYRLRNDMGISGTTGTITLQPTSGTIDGQSSLALLPQQECTLITDGTNWRTHGLKREVILGTLDITSAVASATVLLPGGYRLFVLDFTALLCSVDAQNILMTYSSDGGSTFYSTGYYHLVIYNNATTTAAALSASNAATNVIGSFGTTLGASAQLKIYPGSATQRASFLSQNAFFSATSGYIQEVLGSGFLAPATPALMNAVKFTPQSGTINNMFLTVKGVV